MKSLSPTLWRTCRVLALPVRLNLLRVLFAEREASVERLARETGILESVASTQLRAIGARGLISARPDGRRVFYSAVPNPAVEHAAPLLKSIRKCIDAGMENNELIHMATAFTHQRRIAIVRQLRLGGCTFSELSIGAQISDPALYRHLNKLLDRSMVILQDDRYLLAKPGNMFGEALLMIATT